MADTKQFEAGIGRVQSGLASTSAAARAAGDQTAAATNVGSKAWESLGKYATAGALVVGAASVKMAADFETQMERLATQAQVPQSSIKGLGDSVLDLAGEVATNPTSLAQALYHVMSAFQSTGITSAKAMEILKVAAEGAKIGGSNLVDTTNALDAAIVSGIRGAEDYSAAMGALNATVGAGDMTMQNLAEALSNGVMPVVKNYGLSLLDVGAALATFGDNNIRGAEAGTALRMAVQALAVPIKGGAKDLEAMGLNSRSMAQAMQNQGGLIPALELLKKHMEAAGITGDRVGQELTTIFGKRAGTGVAILYDQLDRLKSKYGDISAGAKGFGTSWEETTKTFNFQVDKIVAGLESWGIKLGQWLIPKLLATGEFIGQHSAQIAALAEMIGTVLVVAIGNWIRLQAIAFGRTVLSMLGSITDSVLALGAAIDGVSAGGLASLGAKFLAVGAAVAGATYLYNRFRDEAKATTSELSALSSTVDSKLVKSFEDLSTKSRGWRGAIKGFLDDIGLAYPALEAQGNAKQITDTFTQIANQSEVTAQRIIDNLRKQGKPAEEFVKILQNVKDAHKKAADAAADQTAQLKTGLEAALKATGGEAAGTSGAVDKMAGSLNDANKAVETLKGGLDALVGIHVKAARAAITYANDLQSLTDGFATNGATIDINTEAGRKNKTGVLNLISAIEAQASAMTTEGATTEEVNATLQGHIGQLKGVMSAAGLTTDQIAALIAEMGLVPKDVSTNVTAPGLDDVQRQVDNYLLNIGRIPTMVATDVVTRYIQEGQAIAAQQPWSSPHATGGLITSPEIALIGEAGPELILPLNDMTRTMNLLGQSGLLKPFAPPTPSALSGGSSAPVGGIGTTIINIAAGAIVVSGAQSPTATADAIQREFLQKIRRGGSLGVA